MLTLQTAIFLLWYCRPVDLSPEYDNLFVITLSAMRGVRAGLWVVLGLCTGLIFHTRPLRLVLLLYWLHRQWRLPC